MALRWTKRRAKKEAGAADEDDEEEVGRPTKEEEEETKVGKAEKAAQKPAEEGEAQSGPPTVHRGQMERSLAGRRLRLPRRARPRRLLREPLVREETSATAWGGRCRVTLLWVRK